MLIFNMGVQRWITKVLFATTTMIDSSILVLLTPTSFVSLEEITDLSLHFNIKKGLVKRVIILLVVIDFFECIENRLMVHVYQKFCLLG